MSLECPTSGQIYLSLQRIPSADIKKPSERKFFVVEKYIEQYKAIKTYLQLDNPVISYPACGEDTSLVEVFPDSTTYYIDINLDSIKALKRANLPKSSHLIHGSAFGYQYPEPLDLIVLRNAFVNSNSPVALTYPLKEGGYVMVSHWGSSSNSKEFAKDPNFELIGFMQQGEDLTSVFFLDRKNPDEIKKSILEDNDITHYPNRAYVFQKNSKTS